MTRTAMPGDGAPTPVPTAFAPATLAIDIGGTGLKATVLDPAGRMLHERLRIPTAYPLRPEGLIASLRELVEPLPLCDRVSAGFPGVVRDGRVLSAPHFVTVAGPGSRVDRELERAWSGFDLAGALATAFGLPARVLNDADLQGLDVIQGEGSEVVITLGTGFGTAFFERGHLGPHFEFAHHRFRKGQTYNEQLGDAARKRVGNKRWNRRVAKATANLRALVPFDHLYIGGGNARHLRADLPDDVTIIDANAGLLGGLRLWADAQE